MIENKLYKIISYYSKTLPDSQMITYVHNCNEAYPQLDKAEDGWYECPTCNERWTEAFLETYFMLYPKRIEDNKA